MATQGQSDHTLVHKTLRTREDHIVYVDDIVLTGNHVEEMTRVKTLLAKEFEMKDLGHLKYFL